MAHSLGKNLIVNRLHILVPIASVLYNLIYKPLCLKSKRNHNLLLGIDIGGTGIKGGVVDLSKGVLVGERVRIDTPQPATPRPSATWSAPSPSISSGRA